MSTPVALCYRFVMTLLFLFSFLHTQVLASPCGHGRISEPEALGPDAQPVSPTPSTSGMGAPVQHEKLSGTPKALLNYFYYRTTLKL